MKATYLIVSLSILTLFSCDNTDDNAFTPTLPAITQTGENTFGCYIDGNLLIPRDGSGSFNSPDRGMRMIAGGIPPSITYNELKIRDFKSGNGGLLTIHIQDLHQIGQGTYSIDESNCQDNVDSFPNVNLFCRWWDASSQNYKWYCSIENGGSLIITRYDFENGIVSGTFNCTVKNRDDSNELIEITQGRFDINGYTLESTSFP